MEKEHRILKSVASIGIVTACSRVFGYIRDAVLAWALGATMSMDAFSVAYRLANLFRRLVGEGAMSAAFVPVFIQYRKENSEAELWEFARKFFYTLALISGAIVVLEIMFAPWIVRVMAPGFLGVPGKMELTIFLTRIMAPYLVFVSLTALVMGILNSLGSFTVPAAGPIFFNVTVIISAVASAYLMRDPVSGIAAGVLLGGIFQFACQLPIVAGHGMKFKIGFSFSHPAIRKTGLLLAPSIFAIGIVQINLLVDSLLASFLREGSVSQIYYADRIVELVLGIFTVSLATVALPEMSRSVAEKKIGDLKDTVLFSLRTTAFVAIPATMGLFFLAEPIVHVLFERGRFSSLDTERTAVTLAFLCLGLFFMAAVRFLVSAFYAFQDTRTPVKVAFIALLVNAGLDFVLMHPLKQAGLALSTAITSALSFTQLLIQLEKKCGAFEWGQMRRGVVKMIGASVIMSASCWGILKVLHYSPEQLIVWKALSLGAAIGGGVGVYLAMMALFGADELQFFLKQKSISPKT